MVELPECRRRERGSIGVSLQVMVSSPLGQKWFLMPTRPKPPNPIIKERCFIVKGGFEFSS